MANINIRSMEDILTEVDMIKSEVNQCKPFGITFDEALELCDDLQSHAKNLLIEIQTIRRCAKALHDDGLIPGGKQSKPEEPIQYKFNRADAIKTIELLYPADNNQAGPDLLWKAICQGWRSLPDLLLERYLQFCIDEDQRGVE